MRKNKLLFVVIASLTLLVMLIAYIAYAMRFEVVEGRVGKKNCIDKGFPCSEEPYIRTEAGEVYRIDNYPKSKLGSLLEKEVIIKGVVSKNKGFSDNVPPSFQHAISVQSLEVKP